MLKIDSMALLIRILSDGLPHNFIIETPSENEESCISIQKIGKVCVFTHLDNEKQDELFARVIDSKGDAARYIAAGQLFLDGERIK